VTQPRLLGAILLAAAWLRLWGIGFGLPHPMTRPDEEFLIGKALGIFSDYNPHFFEWPSLYFYVVHAVFRIVYWAGYLAGTYRDTNHFVQASVADPAWIYLTLRLMSAIAGTATVLVVHGICRVLFDRWTAAVAAFFLAVAYLHVRDSHFGVLDVPLTLLVAVTVRVLAAAWISPRPMVLLLCAGVVAGLASSIKYNAAALLAPCGVVTALKLIEASRPERARVLAAGIGCLLLFAAAFVLGSPYVVLDPDGFREGIGAQVTRLSGGHGIAVANVWRQQLTFSLWYGVGGPVLVASALGLAYLTWLDWRRAAIVAAFPLAYFAVIGSGYTAFIRYATPLVPFVCIFAAAVVSAAASRSGARAPAVAMATAVVLALPSTVVAVRFNRMLTEGDSRVLAGEWLATQVAPDQTVHETGALYAHPTAAWPPGRSRMAPVGFDANTGRFSARDGAVERPDWIVVAESPLRLYTPVAPELRSILAAEYQRVQVFSPTREPEPEAWFDRQDAFFLPYANFSRRERPGPQLSIYRRTAGQR